MEVCAERNAIDFHQQHGGTIGGITRGVDRCLHGGDGGAIHQLERRRQDPGGDDPGDRLAPLVQTGPSLVGTGVFARRPAPVQVNWLGYPGTMATPYHHYIIADDWIVPQGSEIYYSEKVLRLPCYQPNDRKRVVSQRKPTRAEAGSTPLSRRYGRPDFTKFTGVLRRLQPLPVSGWRAAKVWAMC